MFVDEKRSGESQIEPAREPWRQLLLDGADLIEQRGHCKQVVVDDKNRLCIYGALNVATGGSPHQRSGSALVVDMALSAVSQELGGYGPMYTITWNNADGTTAENVVSIMRKVANGKVA